MLPDGFPKRHLVPEPKLTALYRYGLSTPETRRAHTDQCRGWRRAVREAEFDEPTRLALLDTLAEHPDITEAAPLLDLTPGIVYGRMRWDLDYADRVDAVLAAHCRAGDRCGTASGHKNGGRCRDCRASKRGASNVTGFRLRRPRPSATATRTATG